MHRFPFKNKVTIVAGRFASLAFLLSSASSKADITWLGGDVTTPASWAAGTNWSGGNPPTNSDTTAATNGVLIFGTSTVTTMTHDGDRVIQAMRFTGANNFTLNSGSGGVLYLQNGIEVQGGTQIIGAGIRPKVSGALSIVNNGTLLDFNGDFMFHRLSGSTNLITTFSGTGATEVQRLMRRDAAYDMSIVKEGTGTLTIVSFLSSAGIPVDAVGNAQGMIAGSTTINGGKVRINNEANLGSNPAALAPAHLTLNGGTLGAFSTFTMDDVNRGITLGSAGGTFDVEGTFEMTVNNPITGAANLTKTGTGTLKIAGATNSYTGVTVLEGGILNFASIANYNAASSLGNRASDTSTEVGLHFRGGTLQYTGATAQSTNRAIRINLSGGTIDASGSVPAATLSFTASSSPNLFETQGNRTLTLTGTNTGDNLFAIALTNQSTNPTSLTKNGAGKWILSNANASYSGATAINAGILAVAGGNAIGNDSAVTLANVAGATLQLNANETIGSLAGGGSTGGNVNLQSFILSAGGTSNTSFAGTISGTGGFTKTGTGTLTLSGTSTYSGITTFEGGIVNVASIANLGTNSSLGNRTAEAAVGGVGLVFKGGTLQYTGSTAQTTDRAIRVSVTGGAFIDASGSTPTATLSFTRASSPDFWESSGDRQITLTGSNTGDNLFNMAITQIGGATTVNKTGTGTWILGGTSTYTGATNVNAGTLFVNGILANTATTVASGATLGGTGSIGGIVTVDGILSPGHNGAGNFTAGSLILNSGSKTIFGLNTPNVVGGDNDLVTVTNDLTLGGLFDINGGSSFANGTYRLFNYGGTRSGTADGSSIISSAPAGFSLAIETDTTLKQVNLIVSQGGLYYWDGADTTANGTVDGGSSSWSNVTSNWTNQNGNPNFAWVDGSTAVFKDSDVNSTGGTVTLTDNFQIAGLQFGTDNYTLTGDSLEAMEAETQLLVDAGLTATLDVSITGTGGILKNGEGTIVLSQTNTFAGNTTLNQGTLQISQDANLGDAASSVTFTGGTLRTTSSFSSARTVSLTGNGTFETDASTELTWSGNVTGAGSLIKSGAGTLILAGNLDYTGSTTVSNGTLQFNSDVSALTGDLSTNATVIFNNSVNSSFSGNVNGTGDLVKNSSSELVLTGALTHSGNTILNAGTLSTGSLTNSALQLVGGSFSPNGTSTASIAVRNLSLNGSTLLWDIGANGTDRIISVEPATLNATTLFAFNATNVENGTYSLISGTQANWDLSLLSYSGIDDLSVGLFLLSADGTELFFSAYSGGVITGDLLQNSTPVGTPTVADFLVVGNVQTGTSTENNTINSLIFTPDSKLQVNNDLTVTSGNFTVDLSTATIAGDNVITPANFTKLGSGELVVNADVAVAGNAFIQSGALRVNSSFQASEINVLNGALLGGNGSLKGNVFNNGTVAPGSSVGILSVIGNYTQMTAGALEIEIASTDSFDQLLVSGVAQLAGSLNVINDGPAFAYGDSFSFLQADEIVGGFDTINLGTTAVRGRFINEGEIGRLVIAPLSYTQVARTPNQRNVARALDEWIGEDETDIANVTRALDELRGDQYAQAFESIAPGYYQGALDTGVELSHSHSQLLHQQLSARRLGQRSGQNHDQLGQRSYPEGTQYLSSSSKGAKYVEPVALENDYRWNTWIQGSGLFSSGGLSLTLGESFESGTFMVGADYAVNEHLAIGFFASYQEGWGDYNHGGSIDLESVRFGIYATIDYGGFYANAAIGGGTNSYDIKRPIQWNGFDRTARGEPDGTEFFALLGTGYDFTIGNLTFGPQVSAQYTKIKFGTFNERGAGSLNLRVQDAEAESFRTYIGGRLAYTFNVTENVAIIPELRVFWKHEFLGGSENLRSHLNGGSGPAFDYLSSEPESDTVYAGAGIGFQIGPRFYGNIYYNADFGRNSDDINHTVSLSASWKF